MTILVESETYLIAPFKQGQTKFLCFTYIAFWSFHPVAYTSFTLFIAMAEHLTLPDESYNFCFCVAHERSLKKFLHHIIWTGPSIRYSLYSEQSVSLLQNILTLLCRNRLIGHFIVILHPVHLSHQLNTHSPIVIPKVWLFFCVCDRMLRIKLTTVVKLWTQFCLSEISK